MALVVSKRLERDLGKVQKDLEAVEKKLSRPDFVDRAPAEIVQKEGEKVDRLRERQATEGFEKHLKRIGVSVRFRILRTDVKMDPAERDVR